MLHHLRNIFDDKELYITKRKLTLIQEKHPKEFQYIKDDQFQKILNGTVANCEYGKDKEIINFISFVDGTYILYGISNNSFYTHLSTIFYPSKKQLKNCQETMNFFSENFKSDFEKYIN